MSQILQVDNWTTKKFHKSPTHHLLQVATEHPKKIQTTSQVFNSSDLSSWQDKSPSQKGWVSIDRSVVAALPSTTPRPVHKSSTDDLGPPLC